MPITDSLLKTYADADGLELGRMVTEGEVTPAELVECAVTTIERLNPELNAVIHKLYDMGRKAAETVDRSAPFAGVPYLLKELASSWEGAPLTNSSYFLKAIQEDLDLSESMDAAVNSLRIVLAAEQSIQEQRAIDLG